MHIDFWSVESAVPGVYPPRIPELVECLGELLKQGTGHHAHTTHHSHTHANTYAHTHKQRRCWKMKGGKFCYFSTCVVCMSMCVEFLYTFSALSHTSTSPMNLLGRVESSKENSKPKIPYTCFIKSRHDRISCLIYILIEQSVCLCTMCSMYLWCLSDLSVSAEDVCVILLELAHPRQPAVNKPSIREIKRTGRTYM